MPRADTNELTAQMFNKMDFKPSQHVGLPASYTTFIRSFLFANCDIITIKKLSSCMIDKPSNQRSKFSLSRSRILSDESTRVPLN